MAIEADACTSLKIKHIESDIMLVPRTYADILLEMFLAADEMRDLRRHLRGKRAAIDLDPCLHLVGVTPFSKVSSDGNSEIIEWLAHG